MPFETTRFAPSPTGRLHLGHARSALFAQDRTEGGRFLLRIEDIDTGRCRPEYEQAIYEDLHWLGLCWEDPVRRQSDHFAEYREALDRLENLTVLYPCFCTRKDIGEAPSAPHGPDGAIYPGTCRDLSRTEKESRMASGKPYALRLDTAKALRTVSGPLRWHDRARGWQEARPEIFGDVVLARKDTPASYHLCVALDDHLQGITLVTRGADLFEATHLHRLLQALLDCNVPEYHHHPLLLDEHGHRFAKRNSSVTLAHLRDKGVTAEQIRQQVTC